MAVSITSLCNQALRKAGEQTIMSLDEDSKNAKLCNEFYEQVLEEVLRSHDWNCASFRTELAEDIDSPAYGWENSFPLPTSPRCLRVIRMEYTDYEWAIEGRKLLTDEDTAKILYIGYVDDPNDLDALCRKVFVLELAVAIAYTLVENGAILNVLMPQLKNAWEMARSMDSHEGTVMQTHNSAWLNSRHQGIGAGILRNNVR